MGRLITAILLLAVLVTGLRVERAPLLRGAADLWIVSDPVTRSDVVVVLGSGLTYGPYKKGLVTKVLVSQVAEETVGEACNFSAEARAAREPTLAACRSGRARRTIPCDTPRGRMTFSSSRDSRHPRPLKRSCSDDVA